MKISLKRNELLDLQMTCKKEYLLTNGKGGYCASSVLDCHTRKYHGLLILPMEGTDRIYNYLSKIELKIVTEDKEFQLSTNKFPGVYSPTGHKYADSFEMELYPVTTYNVGGVILKKSVIMPFGEDTVLVKYDLIESEQPLMIKATPLFAYREAHALARENMDIKPRSYFEENGFKFDPYKGLPPVYLQTSGLSVFYPAPHWLYNFEYLKERNRGYDYQEDLFAPGVFEITMNKGESLIFRASLTPAKDSFENEWNKEEKRLRKLAKQFEGDKDILSSLKLHSDKFIIRQGKNITLKAGFYWHDNLSRDALISLPGLFLCRNELELAQKLLEQLAKTEKDGLLPTRVFNSGHKEYGSLDVSFLFILAVQHYIAYGGDKNWVKEKLLKTIQSIVISPLSGKIDGVVIGDDGLYYATNDQENRTWMDGTEDGRPITPRYGAAVEINALWYNALTFIIKDFGKNLSKDVLMQLKEAQGRFESNFENNFWNEADACLYDVDLGFGNKVNYIRPNQLFAIGLPYTCISNERAKIILEVVDKHLVTPYGLRTLSPRNPKYKGEYKGEERIRNSAYHMGMIWPWFIGIYMDAMLKHFGSKSQVKMYFKENFPEMWSVHTLQYGLFHISELFRPNPPYVAKACVAQASSEGELIRVLDTLKI